MCTFATSLIFIKVERLKNRLKEYQIKYYQAKADLFILALKSAQQANNDKMFNLIYAEAMNFNDYCVEKEIYLN